MIGRNAYAASMKAIVSEKGQVTIPKSLRAKLGIRRGTVIEFEADRGRLIGRKADTRDAIDELFGSLTMPEPVDEYIDRARGR
jgi:antitoxin PrlF